jgi:hypothetical protein
MSLSVQGVPLRCLNASEANRIANSASAWHRINSDTPTALSSKGAELHQMHRSRKA